MLLQFEEQREEASQFDVEISLANSKEKKCAAIAQEILVREEGFEPPRACARQVLSLLRLPVPPFPRRHQRVYHAPRGILFSV
jgi:hypothetical protein